MNMLGKDLVMEDIDVDQWRNAQDLLLESAKEKRRIVILHDNGVIRKCGHTEGIPIVGAPTSITDAQSQAHALYEANKDSVDFVAIFERHAFDEYFSRMQASWVADEPLDSFVSRQYGLLDSYPDTMVTYPGPAKNVLGLQYRFGVTRNEALVLAAKWVAPNSSLLLGVYDEGELWTSLVMSFDQELVMTELTTVDAERVDIRGDMGEVTSRAFEWMTAHHKPSGSALVWTREAFERFREAKDKEAAVTDAVLAGAAVVLRSE
jgi:hypothetical protein